MPDAVFLPYRFAEEALDLHLLELRVDGNAADPDEYVDRDAHQINLAGLEAWQEASFSIQVKDASRQVEAMLVDGEDPELEAQVILLLRNPRSRLRKAIPLELKNDNCYEGSFSLARADWVGSVAVEAVAVRATSRDEKFGFATRAGQRIAGSCKWSLYIDDRPIMPGGAIDGQWRDFANDDNPELRSRSECGWYLDLTDHERPTLFLNEGVAGLRRILEVTAIKGRSAYLRDVSSHSILSPALLEMAVFAVNSSRGGGLSELADWRRGLLVALAKLCDGKSEEAKIESWLAANDPDAIRSVLCDLTTAVQRYLGTFGKIEKLLRSLEDASNA